MRKQRKTVKKTQTNANVEPDLRDEIFRTVDGRKVTGVIIADDEGIVAETNWAADESKRIGLTLLGILEEGSPVRPGDEIARFSGSPKQVVSAEDVLIGLMAKPSGIATAARAFVMRADGRPEMNLRTVRRGRAGVGGGEFMDHRAISRRSMMAVSDGKWCRKSAAWATSTLPSRSTKTYSILQYYRGL